MARFADRQTSAERGFTLIELLVAVVLVSVLAAVVLPAVNRFVDSGTEEARLTEFHDVETAVILMMTHNEILSIPNLATGCTPPCTAGTKVLSGFPDAHSDARRGAGARGRVARPVRATGVRVAGTGVGALSTPVGEAEGELFVETFTAALEQKAAV